MVDSTDPGDLYAIAIIGMAGRFPGARTLEAFWRNLRAGVESITFFSDEELTAAGVDPALLRNPHYVKAKGVLDEPEYFDAQLFSCSPREASLMDPQQRLFLECAWAALENAGYDAEKCPGRIGVYAGVGFNGYLLSNLYPNRDLHDMVGNFQTTLGNDKDYLATRVSYKLNLKGPSLSVQTACSSSLVAVHLACQSLLNRECFMALAGGVSVGVPHKTGYLFQEGAISSPDGHCRAFDARARGTVSGSGAAVVVLKRLADALADGDQIDAIIKGSAINNDGALKVGYTAPSIDGQAQVIAEALAMAGVEPTTISYVEAHGTGTVLGDPIEIAALTQAFRAYTQANGFCAIGSVKTNIGHLDTAAGVAGLIKTVLALKHRALPASLHFDAPNPQIDFANTPFYVNSDYAEWQAAGPRRAGVSSFGIGGTNAHIVLEEAPSAAPTGAARPWQLLLLSAQTSTALESATTNLAEYVQAHPQTNLADVAYTLQLGRRDLRQRRMLLWRGDEVGATLALRDPQRVLTSYQEPGARPVVFMFPGQGSQYVGMAAELYQAEPLFRVQVDRCAALLVPHLGCDLREIIYPTTIDDRRWTIEAASPSSIVHRPSSDAADAVLNQTLYAQPALFVIEYALAQLWMSWGILPEAMIGHSIGEYVAACLAGVFALDDALALVAARGRLMQALPGGAMLAVPLPEHEVFALLGDQLALAAVNGPAQCVVSGPADAVARLAAALAERGLTSRMLHTSHAFHSAMMEPIMAAFAEQVRRVQRNPVAIPYISNLTGDWISDAQATDPDYWVRQLRETVRFDAGLRALLAEPSRVLLEVGPGDALCRLAQRSSAPVERVALSSLRRANAPGADQAVLLTGLGRLWLAGVQPDWAGFYANERRRRVALPGYPFERQRYWIDPPSPALDARRATLNKRPDIAEWFYAPSWHGTIPPKRVGPAAWSEQQACWLVFLDECGLGAALVQRLANAAQRVISVAVGERFVRLDERSYALDPADPAGYAALIAALCADDQPPQIIAHLWGVTPSAASDAALETTQARGFYSLLVLAQALGTHNLTDPLHIGIVTSAMHVVSGDERVCPAKATVLGPCNVIPREYANITCCNIDLVLPESASRPAEWLIDQLLDELAARSSAVVAYRGRHRWLRGFEAVRLPALPCTPRLREGGVYLITGGLGGIGMVLAEYLARTVRARLVLLGRSAFPARDDWERWLAQPASALAGTIRQLQALEACGAQVLVVSADVADLAQMQRAFATVAARFGAINGVIHAAGVAGGGVIQLKTHEQAAAVLAPKVIGTLVLDQLLRDSPLDFFVLCSSLNAMLGSFGQVDYCAANAFLDAYAQGHAADGRCTATINWAAWQAVGMAANSAVPSELRERQNERLKHAIAPSEGLEAFVRILDNTLPQVLVSPQDLHALLERRADAFSEALPERAPTAQHPRSLANAFVAPSSAFEQIVANLWQELFGIAAVGANDSFFEMGGDSLLAVQFLNKLHTIYPVEIALASLFAAPTVAGVAELLEQAHRRHNDRQAKPILDLLDQAFPTERPALLEAYLNEKVATLGPPHDRPVNAGLHALPDPLVTDLIIHFKRDLRLPVYPHEIARLPSLGALATYLVAELDRRAGGMASAVAPVIDRAITPIQRERRAPVVRTQAKNRSMVFLLSSARAGSTLLRVMLAGHPALFCPPELALLGRRSMRERNEALLHPARGHGLQRALMELKNITADAADALVAALVEQDADTQAVYRMLQELAGARLLVDKTPGYALSLATLERAEELFEAPRYIHLTRHPYAVIESIMRNRMDQLLGLPTADPFQVAEEVWTTANRNVLDFLRQVDMQRQHRVSYEELVAAPAVVMADLCAFLGLPFDDAVLSPYRGRRMSDGIGDPNFHEHSAIEPSLGDAWRQVRLPRRLSEPARELALALSYELPEALRPPTMPLSFAQERLWFLHQLDPSSPAYNLPKAIQIGGPLRLAVLRRCLNEMLRRHAILRTAFVEVAGLPAQVIAPALRITLPLIDLTALPPTERAATARQLLVENARLPFDLARAPLLRVLLLRLAADDHALLTTPHHIVFDRWSRGVLDREMAALYGAFSTGQPSPLPALPLQYADVARWQRGWLRGEGDNAQSPLQTQLTYWRNQLGGDLTVLELPTDRARPPVERFRGAERVRLLPQQLGQALKALSQREGVTLFMTLLAAFQMLLARYSGQADLAVGSPVTQRSRAETELLIGPFINMLVLRSDLAGEPSFRGLLGRVREVTLGAFAHQDAPFEHLVRALQPARDLSRQPLFQVTFILQNIPAAAIPYPGLTFRPLKVESGTALVDLTLIAVETAHGISTTLNYNTDLFDQATIARMLTHFQTLLESALAAPDRSIWALPLLTEAERQQLLLDWNDTGSGIRGQASGVETPRRGVSTPDAGCLHQLFEAQAARTPDAVALVCDFRDKETRRQGDKEITGRTLRDKETTDHTTNGVAPSSIVYGPSSIVHLTYAALNARANQLAQHLRGFGVGPETPVAVCIERSVELLIGLLGVLKAGGAYLPLDPTYPRERLAAMLEDSQARVLLIGAKDDGRRTMDDLEESQTSIVNRKSKIVNLQTDWPTIAQTSTQPPAAIVNRQSEIVNPDNLAYIIYTSGSTGQPKGVMIAHQSLVNLLCAMRERPGFSANDVLLAVTTLSFDIAALELFLPLITGGRLVVASRETAADGQLLLAALARCGATTMQATPISWRILLESGWTGAQRLNVLCGGEPLPRELADALLERSAAVWNMYGPTETTVWSALQPITRPGAPPPIGRPIANTHMYILDRQLRPAPIGVVGELYIGGVGVARGYLGQPALTAERFVPDPFAEVSGAGYRVSGVGISNTRYPTPDTRLYKTGDLARYLPDGTIECLGRRDQQVKVRGFRIELGEIEAALAQHPAVRASAVVAHAGPLNDMRLVAYVVTTKDDRPSTIDDGSHSPPSSIVYRPSSIVNDLRAFLHERLPNYMIPVVFVALDRLPLTPSGKLNRRALPAPDAAAVLPSAEYEPPHDPTQAALAEIWAQVLEVRVGIHDNFFALGGHSLLATQVMSRVRATFKVELSVRTLFESTTVAALAQRIDTIQWAAQDQPAASDAADDHEEIAF